MEHLSYPGESAEYRAARNHLLDAEIALRRQIEEVAAMRRALPPGGAVLEDYKFERIGANGMPEKVRLSQLFGDKPSVLLYSFMYGPDRNEPCRGCTHTLDGIDGAVQHAEQRMPIYIVAKSPLARLIALAHERGWDHLTLLSDTEGRYTADYFGDTSKLSQAMRTERNHDLSRNFDEPMYNVFTPRRRYYPPLLGQRIGLCARRAGPEPPRRRSGRPGLGPARHEPRGPRRILPQPELSRACSEGAERAPAMEDA